MNERSDGIGPTELSAFQAPAGHEVAAPGEAYFAEPSQEADQAFDTGVVWRAPWERRVDGTAIATRRYLRSLAMAGVPVQLCVAVGTFQTEDGYAAVPTENDIDPAVIREVGDYRKTHLRNVSIWIDHLVPGVERLRGILWPGNTRSFDAGLAERTHPYRIALTVWERNRCSREIAALLSRFGQCWVPCRANRDCLIQSGVPEEKVHVVPHPYPPVMRPARLDPPFGNRFVFYHVGKWEPRKNQHEMLGAFLRQFSPEGPAAFVLKTSRFVCLVDYPEGPEESLRTWLDTPAVRARGWTAQNVSDRVLIAMDPMSEEDMTGLHLRGHAYVSASHGEAWDLPAFDALLHGAQLVHVGYGGSEDYAPEHAIRIWNGVDMETTHSSYGWRDTRWARVDPGRIEQGMRLAYTRRACDMPVFDTEPYSFRTVGLRMRGLIETLIAEGRRAALDVSR